MRPLHTLPRGLAAYLRARGASLIEIVAGPDDSDLRFYAFPRGGGKGSALVVVDVDEALGFTIFGEIAPDTGRIDETLAALDAHLGLEVEPSDLAAREVAKHEYHNDLTAEG